MRFTRRLACSFFFVVLGPVVAGAGTDHGVGFYERLMQYQLDSGHFDNPGNEPTVVFRRQIDLGDGVAWARVLFASADLPPGSQVRVTALLDGESQSLDARQLEEWGWGTAFFNGSRLLVELIAAPGTSGNFVRVGSIFVGDPTAKPDRIEEICGTDDNRVPSNDPAVGRLLTGVPGETGGTAFIVAPGPGQTPILLSAGQCFTGANVIRILEFNVPLSNTDCTLNHPPTADQYAVDMNSVQAVDGGPGNDYAVFHCFPNPQTRRIPFSSQGAALSLAPSLPGVGQTVRVIGYGIDTGQAPGGGNLECVLSSCNQGLGNQTQQQSAPGPVVAIPGNASLDYVADDCGGNAGSPILDNNNLVVGIQTHGGCAATDPDDRYNSGTPITNPNLLTAIRGVAQGDVCHDFETAAPATGGDADTTWVGDWSFDSGGNCDPMGWLKAGWSTPVPGHARLYKHITDNDVCQENTTCAWLFTDNVTPTLAGDPSVFFGPDGYVLKSWLDEAIVSPWISLTSTPAAVGTILSFRAFPGNRFDTSHIVLNWSVRGRDPVQGDTAWRHTGQWSTLSEFSWVSHLSDLTSSVDAAWTQIQVRFRLLDRPGEPNPKIVGPGPYIDRVRIGRRILPGPVISEGSDSRSQAQDCFPTEIVPGMTLGEHYRPTTDRFGTCALSAGADLGNNWISPNLITADSIWVQVRDLRGADGITSVSWHGAIVAGPHQGKSPAPWAVGSNGFFTIPADSVRSGVSGAVIPEWFFVDVDDTYFRGGDVLVYLWTATDAQAGFTSDPAGLSAVPLSVPQAQTVTAGLFEVNFLPQIDWAPAYLARIAAVEHGDLAPTPSELAASTQRNCILYVQNFAARRMSGQLHRTSFMYALDRLGYHDLETGATYYDVYDHQGMGNTNNQLAGRASVQQAQGYNLIVYENGNGLPGRPLLPDGLDLDTSKIDQATWFRNWLAQASSSAAGFATLWMLGSNTIQEKPTNPLVTGNMGVLLAPSPNSNVNPFVDGQAIFSFDRGNTQAQVDFVPDLFVLDGGCWVVRNYDGINAQGSGVRTHRYSTSAGGLGDGAVVMNRNNAQNWNTIQMSFPWSDIRDPSGQPQNPPPELPLLTKILGAVLPPACLRAPNITDTNDDETLTVPQRTTLHQNVPNPFNPTTQIRFDLAQGGKITLRIYDVSGRLVRTLVDAEMPAGRNHAVLWNGLDDQSQRTASGVYLYRLETPDASLTRKLIMMK